MTTRLILAALAAGLGLLAGCSQGAPPATAPGAPEPASSTSAAPATQAAPAGDDVSAFMDKVMAAHKEVKTYTIEMSLETAVAGTPTTMTFKGVVDQSDRSSIDMSMDINMGGTGTMKTLKVDGAMYLQLGGAGTKWMKVPKAKMAQYEGTTDSADITAGMEKARGAMKKIEAVGDETVDGVATHHYRITVDAAGLSKISGSSASVADADFDYDVWIDDAGLVRKVAMDVPAKAGDDDVPMKMSGVMGHYNEPVSIKAPADKDVVEMGG